MEECQECQDSDPGSAAKTQQKDKVDFQRGSKRRKENNMGRACLRQKTWAESRKICVCFLLAAGAAWDWSFGNEFLLCSKARKTGSDQERGSQIPPLCCRNPKKC